uniref:Uncharacterized protein n=1 Tax=Magallana gigas TaxID=29159 RepID=K1QA10_MAGGI
MLQTSRIWPVVASGLKTGQTITTTKFSADMRNEVGFALPSSIFMKSTTHDSDSRSHQTKSRCPNRALALVCLTV